MDVKCPGSGESGSLYENNLLLLSKRDDLKFVVADRNDFLWALDLIKQRHLQEKTEIIFSPALPHLDPALLARWLIENGLTARLGLQLHKFIWPSAERGV
jgi:7-carboxy-7-deazaguanine synthase